MIPDELSGGPHFAAFCRRYVKHTKGRWAGNVLEFEDWQREFWWEALELDPATGLRVYSEVGLGLPRKNGKSTMASAAGLYLLAADGEPEPEVIVGAAARNQAGIVLGQSRRMALASPLLLDHLKVYRYHLECPANGGTMRSVSSDAPLQHGLNPSGNIIDELHAHKSPELYTALTTGTGAREQPFTLWITTAGVAGEGILGKLYASMTDGPGTLEDRGALRIYRDRANGQLIYWYGVPRNADVEDPEAYLAANPASWLRDGRELARELGKMKARGAMLEWRRYHANQPVEIEEAWLPPGAWEACRDGQDAQGRWDRPLNPELPIGVGIDKGQTSDRSAIVIAQRQGDDLVIRARFFAPEAATGRVNTEAMRKYLRELRDRFPRPMMRHPQTQRPLRGPACAFDRWAFSESAEMLEEDGLNMVDFPQWASTMGPASTQAYELITTRRVYHDGDAQLAEHVAHTSAILTERGMKVAKATRPASHPNDGAVALVMASSMAMLDAPAPRTRKPTRAVGF